MHSVLTANTLARMMRAGDSRRFRIDLAKNRTVILAGALEAAAQPPDYSAAFPATVKGRECVSLKNYSLNLILRAISRYLTWRFGLRVRGRDEIVREVVESLGDSTPMYIIRRDIESFYESVPIERVRGDLLHTAVLPIQPRLFIKAFFDKFCGAGGQGVPRGVGLSAIIAELAMKDVDSRIREIPGVYKYFRYSDDILIFSYLPPAEIASHLVQIIGPHMSFNESKAQDVSVVDSGANVVDCSFEYLGYRFSFRSQCGSSKPREVRLAISEKKINRMKTKVICSLKSFRKNHDMGLLRDRLTYASGNFYAYRRGARFIKQSRYARAGIYFNYHLCGTYRGSVFQRYDCRELKALDGFFQSMIKSAGLSGPFAHAIQKISFYKGYEKRMMVRFNPQRVQQITAAWRNA